MTEKLSVKISEKINEAIKILKALGMPKNQVNSRTALCLLALLNLKPLMDWNESKKIQIGITPIMNFARENYNEAYAPNSRETFRKQSIHQFVQAGFALINPDNPNRPTNSPETVYQLSDEIFVLLLSYKSDSFDELLKMFLKNRVTLQKKYASAREMSKIPVRIKEGIEIKLSSGKHSQLIKDIIDDFAPRFFGDSDVVYIGDTREKFTYFDEELAKKIYITINEHGKMPDVILFQSEKNWLILIEAVTSHGPIDGKRYIELSELFSAVFLEKIYITAFPDKASLSKYFQNIAWETEVWVADNPTHMIHFNGTKFLGSIF